MVVQGHQGLAAIVIAQGQHDLRVPVMGRAQLHPADHRPAHAEASGGSTKITSLGRIGLPGPPVRMVARM